MFKKEKHGKLKMRSPVFYQNLWGIAFAVPALILLIVFSVYPLLKAFQISFTSWGLVDDPVFIGLDNYVKLWHGSNP
jgi:multiple sugar transport system permease protein